MVQKHLSTKWCRIGVCMLIAMSLVNCSRGDQRPAPIITITNQDHKKTFNEKIYAPVSRTNTPESTRYHRRYDDLQRGSYGKNTYSVKKGDTLFYIAWISGSDYRDLAKRNNISEPYNIEVGQVLYLGNDSNKHSSLQQISPSLSNKMKQNVTNGVDYQGEKAYARGSGIEKNDNISKMPEIIGIPTIGQWIWPTQGKIISNFSPTEGGNKGIDIAGTRGQPIRATAAGKVVYAGNALRGYGNLIIIKHSDDYLSAYAHNDKMLVKEQQNVQAGQEIATMGSTGTSSVRLHFEIRYKGKSINPLRYLARR